MAKGKISKDGAMNMFTFIVPTLPGPCPKNLGVAPLSD